MTNAEQTILAACRGNAFRTRGTWGMRTNVALGGWKDPNPRVACVVLDLERTRPHKLCGFTVPIVLASGETWEAVLSQLQAAGEIS